LSENFRLKLQNLQRLNIPYFGKRRGKYWNFKHSV